MIEGDWVEVVAPGGRKIGRIVRFSYDTGYDDHSRYVRVQPPVGREFSVRDDAVLRIIDDPVELLAVLA